MSELAQAINEMRNMRESYDQLAATADLYQQGRTALATAITAKGVPTTPTTPLAEMAENVGDIQQVTTTIDGGDMYAAQLFGDGVLWNLYDVLAQMKSQYMGAGHYAALIVCEYYKGYNSLQLQGADAYYTCDGDFYDTSAPLHVWHDADNGKANRWVCFLFATEGARLDITNTAISPRSMYIGGHIGTIEYFVNGRLTELVSGVEETDIIDNFLQKGFTQDYSGNFVLRNTKNATGLNTGSNKTSGAAVLEMQSIQVTSVSNNFLTTNMPYVTIIANTITSQGYIITPNGNNAGYVEINIIGETRLVGNDAALVNAPLGNSSLRKMNAIGLLSASRVARGYLYGLEDFTVGEADGNISFNTWNPTYVLADATKKAQLIENIKNHILVRVSDRTGLSRLTFTVSTNMFNNIASEQIEWQGETMSLADAFLTKNWLLAGA